jgi:hypothetical protein
MNLSVTKRFVYGSAAIFLFLVSLPVLAAAGAKIKIDETKYFQIGMGFRGSVSVNENNATNPGEDSFDLSADNMRLYTVSQVHAPLWIKTNSIAASLRYGPNNRTHSITIRNLTQSQSQWF